jgi:hypothetical protein
MIGFDKSRKILEEENREKEVLEKNIAKEKLERVLQKKFNTTFIGALDSFEQAFGYLWRHGENYASLSENEKRFRELWNDTRNEVLNKGNAQLRGALQEVSEYTLVWNRKNYQFKLENNIRSTNDE